MDNTRAFVEGKKANNVLLFGGRRNRKIHEYQGNCKMSFMIWVFA
ncbi:MAG: hypothetical protein V8R80_09285 [Eubacterium sp.]